jgi:hypothetical protein
MTHKHMSSLRPAKLAKESARIDWIVGMIKQVNDCVERNDRDGLLKLAAEYASHEMVHAATRTTILANQIAEKE